MKKTKTLTKPGPVKAERRKLIKHREEAEPRYILVDGTTYLVPLGYPVDLATARADRARLPRNNRAMVRICRLEVVA